jgi:2-oxo-4-hydroxy-4-carboxy-5-ureidoimidazoline decarboxylase
MDAGPDPLTTASLPQFMQLFGNVFEHSPWLVERAWAQRPFASESALQQAFRATLLALSHDEQLRLIRVHPQLGDKVAIAQGLTGESIAEQASAGLDRLTPAEFERFHALNAAYQRNHGFPFIICVRLHDKAGILSALQLRVGRDSDIEVREAIEQIGQIGRLRIDAVFSRINNK